MLIKFKSGFLMPIVALALFATSCGGGGGGAAVNTEQTQGTNNGGGATPTLITDVTVQSTGSMTQGSVPVTFGQPFKAGDLPAGAALVATDSTGANVPLQMDEVSSHADGTVRFAVLSAQLSNLQANEQRVIIGAA